MHSAPLRVPKCLSFAPNLAFKFFAFFFLGFVCAGYCQAQKPTNEPPKPSFRIAFDAASGRDSCFALDIYVMDQNGEHIKRLTYDHRSHNPSWSPDGRRVAFLRDDCKHLASFNFGPFDELLNFLSTPRHILSMDADGRRSSLVSAVGREAQDTLWLPNGEYIAIRLADRSRLRVHMMGSRLTPNGPPEELLSRYLKVEGDWYRKQYCATSESAFGTTYPVTISCPGGGRLVILIPPVDNFLPTIYGSHGLSNIERWKLAGDMHYSADLNTSLRVISLDGVSTTAPMPAYDSSWSRDGSRIAYSSFSGDQSSVLYVADLHAGVLGEPRALTAQRLDAHGPAWSADGSRIAFIGLWKDSSQIFIVDADGSNLIQLNHDSKMRCSHASWSPDDRWIAAGCSPNVTIVDDDEYVVGRSSHIYLFDTSKPNAKPRQLTECGDNARYDLCGASNPSFAPADAPNP